MYVIRVLNIFVRKQNGSYNNESNEIAQKTKS